MKMTNPSIVQISRCLAQRIEKGQQFTRLDDAILSLNPYEALPMNSTDAMKRFEKRDETQPHVWEVALRAHDEMKNNGRDQSIIISGASGSGKSHNVWSIINCPGGRPGSPGRPPECTL